MQSIEVNLAGPEQGKEWLWGAKRDYPTEQVLIGKPTSGPQDS